MVLTVIGYIFLGLIALGILIGVGRFILGLGLSLASIIGSISYCLYKVFIYVPIVLPIKTIIKHKSNKQIDNKIQYE